MASIYQLKPAFQNLLRPLVRGLVSVGVTPNQVTVLAVLLSAGVGALLLFEPTRSWGLLAIPVALFVRMGLNAIDGMMAREHDMASPLGALLNEVGDAVSDACLYLPFAVVPGVPTLLVSIVVVLAVISEMVGVVAVQIGASRRYDGPMGKSDRAFVFGLIGLLLGIHVEIERWLVWVFAVLILLLVLTIINRAKKALREVEE